MTLEDVAIGAVSAGVNKSTFVLLNVLLGFTSLSLAGLTAVCALGESSRRSLAPHAAALLVLSLLLWCAIVSFIGATGLVDAEQQRRELEGEGAPPASSAAAEKKER